MPIERLSSADAQADASMTASAAVPADACAETAVGAAARTPLPLRWHPAWLIALAGFFGLMVVLGSIPGEAQALTDRYGDKLLHTLAYGFMALLCGRALQAPRMLHALLMVAVIAMLGLLDEGLQSLLPYRNASILDWCFDIGAAAVVAALLACHAHFFQVDEPDA